MRYIFLNSQDESTEMANVIYGQDGGVVDTSRPQNLEVHGEATNTQPKKGIALTTTCCSARYRHENGSGEWRLCPYEEAVIGLNGEQLFSEDTPVLLLEDRYVVEKEKLGEGGCGMVYAGYDSLTEKPLAIKIDKRNGQLLRQESDVYKAVRKTFPDARGFPDVYYQGNEKGMELLVMDQLGHSLLDHFGRHGGLSLKTTLMVGLQVLDRLEHMHKSNFLHCDVKPENLVTGLGKDSSTVYMVDMGLARPYRLQDEPFRAEKSNLADGVVGTLMFAPTGLHGSVEVTRRDDLESLGFSLLFLNQGSLPWEFLAYDNENVAEVQRIKRAFWDSEEYRDMPAVLSRVFNIIRSMKHDEEPCYEKFREVLNTALQEMGERNDGVYDWQRAEQIDSLLPSLFTSTMESTFSSVYIRGLESFEGDSFVTISLTDE